jgi:serine/threonine protein kinase
MFNLKLFFMQYIRVQCRRKVNVSHKLQILLSLSRSDSRNGGAASRPDSGSIANMSVIKSVILADDRPANLPLSEDIVKLCRDAGYDYNVRGIPIIDQSRGVTSAWVKYGNVKMSEALTQDWVGKVLNPKPDAPVRIPTVYQAFEHNDDGFIVMEYIDGSLCDDSDVLQVAAAVECLIRVIGPTTAPGPVGGGLIPHSFFVDRESSVTYDTVQALEKHINGVTLYYHFHIPCC